MQVIFFSKGTLRYKIRGHSKVKISTLIIIWYFLKPIGSSVHSWLLFSPQRKLEQQQEFLWPFLGILNMAFGHMGCLMSVPWWMASFTNISFESTIVSFVHSWPSNCNTPSSRPVPNNLKTHKYLPSMCTKYGYLFFMWNHYCNTFWIFQKK